MTFEDKIWLAVIGGLIGLGTAIVTSWLNRRWLADEVAENSVIDAQIEVYRQLGKNVAGITTDAIQLIAYLAFESGRMKAEGKTNCEFLKEANKEFAPKSIDLLRRVAALKEEYVFLPIQVIASIQTLQEATYEVFKDANPNTLSSFYKISEASDELLKHIRLITADVMSRKQKISALIEKIPEHGFASSIERKAVEELRNTK